MREILVLLLAAVAHGAMIDAGLEKNKHDCGTDAVTGKEESPRCESDWCSAQAADMHCTMCGCKACSFCGALSLLQAIAACTPVDKKDSSMLTCRCVHASHTLTGHPHRHPH